MTDHKLTEEEVNKLTKMASSRVDNPEIHETLPVLLKWMGEIPEDMKPRVQASRDGSQEPRSITITEEQYETLQLAAELTGLPMIDVMQLMMHGTHQRLLEKMRLRVFTGITLNSILGGLYDERDD